MTNYDDMKFAVEALSGGQNTVKLDDLGAPSVMVAVNKMTYGDVISGGSSDVLPAFIVDGEEIETILVSKYPNIVINSRGYSLPMQKPKDYINFDAAVAACRAKGDGWALMTNALWAAIQNQCYTAGVLPHGNSNYGADYTYSHEKGVPADKEAASSFRTLKTLTGSGPATWYTEHSKNGIADLVGNVWEWQSGLRIVDGEIQIIPNGNAMKLATNMGATSEEWKAILQSGTLVAPGTADTLKYNASGNIDTVAPAAATPGKAFSAIAAETGVTIPNLLRALGLAPVSGVTYGNGYFYLNTEGERLPVRGASFANTSYAGLAALSLNSTRTDSGNYIGFRSVAFK